MIDRTYKFRSITFFIFIAIILRHNDAQSTDWTPVYKSSQNESSYFVDLDTILQDGAFAKAWILEDKNTKSLISPRSKALTQQSQPKSIKGFKSYVSMYIIDCERKNSAVVRGLYFSDFRGRGDMVSAFERDFDSSSLKPVKSKSLDETVLKIVCARANEKPRIQA